MSLAIGIFSGRIQGKRSTIMLWVALFLVLGGACAPLRAEEPRPMLDREHAIDGWSMAFFHPESEVRLARLRVGRVRVDYEKRGFLRVAWAPRLVLEDMELTVDDPEAWRVFGPDLIEALRRLRPDLPLRIDGLRVAEGGRLLVAEDARLETPERLRLRGVEAHEGSMPPRKSERGLLWLSGPEAGRATALDFSPEPSAPASEAPVLSP